ncbi:glutathione S-transferase family protein [Thalassotalea psychrophila]|uniref:Glutathione S-transferase family protein n=1 Tax=Thalassotalea psychrophila TaxID=3065647 RepID=A0ABY9TUC4_9GAMM|nr:glutathione S-transferase family protein [Colwelliaceae bacterium SQ149]
MRLLSSDISPYSTRVRIQIRKKNLPIEICAPQPELRTAEFLSKFPLGKIPVLELDEHTAITESWVIMEYLEQCFTDTSLKPNAAIENAHMAMVGRYADLHLGPSLFPMFKSLLMKTKIDVEQEIKLIKAELQKGENLLQSMPQYSTRSLNIGDIALATTMYFTEATPRLFGYENILADYPAITAWWQWVQQDSAVKQGIIEMENAFKALAG